MAIKVALAGNPNSGKTTLFNSLTGSNQSVGNWPGVTVEKKEGKYKKKKEVIITDLPGIYSLSPYTLEEVVARNYLINEKPDAILNIIDGTNLERNLYLTTQLLELGIPVVMAINMSDVIKKRGDQLNLQVLGSRLGCDVVEISALKETGIDEAMEKVLESEKKSGKRKESIYFSGVVEHALAHIEEACVHHLPEEKQRWTAIKLFERDSKILEELNLSEEVIEHIEKDIQKCEQELDDDSESIITNERYVYITEMMKEVYTTKGKETLSVTDRIDRIVTNRWLALPIFALIMTLVYGISVTTVGTLLTDWTNDVLFGEIIPPAIETILVSLNTSDWLQSLIIDGIVGGVGSVLGFVPQMLVLFAFLAFLEACGYMARVAFIMDRIFRRFGLSGKSFIPMLIGTGCSVPAVMASRTIESQRDRRMTIMTTTFVPCSAKLPIIGLIAGALFSGAWWVAPSAYFIGVVAIIISGIILKKTKLFIGDPSPFVMELPAYHLPTLKNIWRSVWERGWSFIKKAGTIILLSSIVLWFLMQFGWVDGRIQMVEDLNKGFLAVIGSMIAPIFAPIGFGNWQATVATLTGFIAKENVVMTLGVLYGVEEVSETGLEIWSSVATSFTVVSAYSFLVFNLLCAPCFAAIGAIRREMNNAKWTIFALSYQTVFAYGMALMVYQFGNALVFGTFGSGFLVAIGILLIFIYFLARAPRKRRDL